MVKKRRGSAFPFGTGDADDLRTEFLHEKTGLRNIFRFRHMGNDPGAFDDVVIGRGKL